MTTLDVENAFTHLWFDDPLCQNLTWHGVHIHKNPMDLHLYQEIIHLVRPDYIVETGAFMGGSTLFFAHMLDLMDHGSIISIDSEGRWNSKAKDHPRVTCIQANSATPGLFTIPQGSSVFVILDSDHSQVHVTAELELYAPLILPGGFLIAEDTVINHPTPSGGPGPWEAVDEFLALHDNWKLHPFSTRLHSSNANHGYLQRIR